MPLLMGGIKSKSGKRKKGTFVKNITQGRYLGSGAEGEVHEIHFDVVHGSRTRRITMARKKFTGLIFDFVSKGASTAFNPKFQLVVISKLREANRKNGLGLRIPTFRVQLPTRRGGRPALVVTRLNILNPAKMNREEIESYNLDRERQEKVLKRLGYDTHDVFKPVRDKNGVVIAVLADPGLLV